MSLVRRRRIPAQRGGQTCLISSPGGTMDSLCGSPIRLPHEALVELGAKASQTGGGRKSERAILPAR
jgi:hypothetical protein